MDPAELNDQPIVQVDPLDDDSHLFEISESQTGLLLVIIKYKY